MTLSAGAGGMGVVYRARDTRLRRETALKLLPEVADGDATARARLLHEARAAAALNHPNICTIHEVGDVDGVPYIAMEFIGGETLQSILRRRPMPPERVCRIGHQLADALEHAHAHGIIHRDFKTANVMITADGRPKVLDFGIALQLRSPDEATRTMTVADAGRTAGTLAYMAPEVLQGHGADVRSDVWALGVASRNDVWPFAVRAADRFRPCRRDSPRCARAPAVGDAVGARAHHRAVPRERAQPAAGACGRGGPRPRRGEPAVDGTHYRRTGLATARGDGARGGRRRRRVCRAARAQRRSCPRRIDRSRWRSNSAKPLRASTKRASRSQPGGNGSSCRSTATSRTRIDRLPKATRDG